MFKLDNFSGFALLWNISVVNMPPKSVIILTLSGEVKMEPKPAVELTNPKPGINYYYYETDGTSLPNFTGLTPKKVHEENLTSRYGDYIKIHAEGLYKIYTTSDGASIIMIDGKLTMNNKVRHSPEEKSEMVELEADYHRIELIYFQAGVGMELNASIKDLISSTMLFRSK